MESALETPITDEYFSYLNEYIDAIRRAEEELANAGTGLDDAYTELATKKEQSILAQKKYAEALINLATARDRSERNRKTASSVGNWGESAQIYAVIPAVTGDAANGMALLSELFAGAGMMSIAFGYRKQRKTQ